MTVQSTVDRDYLPFRNAIAALDAGDLVALESLLDAHPSILDYQCRRGEWYENGYFSGATLLHHIAGNPDRAPIPANIVELTHAILARWFDQTAAEATIELLLTSRQASERGVAVELIQLLVDRGARFNALSARTLHASLLNHATRTARALVERGATVDLPAGAALGALDEVKLRLAQQATQSELDEALVFACVAGQDGAVALLLSHGARGDVLVSPAGLGTPRTALHEAANRGYRRIVEQLLAAGARVNVREPKWNGTAAGWAEEGGHTAIAALLGGSARGQTPS